jgi:hypothetical protein
MSVKIFRIIIPIFLTIFLKIILVHFQVEWYVRNSTSFITFEDLAWNPWDEGLLCSVSQHIVIYHHQKILDVRTVILTDTLTDGRTRPLHNNSLNKFKNRRRAYLHTCKPEIAVPVTELSKPFQRGSIRCRSKIFNFSVVRNTDSKVHPASISMDTEAGRQDEHSSLSRDEPKIELSCSWTFPYTFMACKGTNLLYHIWYMTITFQLRIFLNFFTFVCPTCRVSLIHSPALHITFLRYI